MTILDTFRGRHSPGDASASSHETGTPSPFEGYDRTESWELIHTLSEHSQIELTAVEAYERAHRNRPAVLDKLHYLRGTEPIPGYDALEPGQILAAVATTDDATLKKMRGYERKFAKRPKLLEAMARTQRERRAAAPTVAVPSYQPHSAPPSSHA